MFRPHFFDADDRLQSICSGQWIRPNSIAERTIARFGSSATAVTAKGTRFGSAYTLQIIANHWQVATVFLENRELGPTFQGESLSRQAAGNSGLTDQPGGSLNDFYKVYKAEASQV
jgi:hypothetical protein